MERRWQVVDTERVKTLLAEVPALLHEAFFNVALMRNGFESDAIATLIEAVGKLTDAVLELGEVKDR